MEPQKKLGWNQIRKEDCIKKFGLIWIKPGVKPLWKYLLPLVDVVE